MTPRARYAAIALACAVLFGTGSIRWRASAVTVVLRPTTFGGVTGPLEGPADSILEQSEGAIVSADPFRLANAPAAVRFTPMNEDGYGGGAAPIALPPRPTMTLKAILGPPWEAIVDGIPGQPPGTRVRAGSAFDRFTARAVTRDSVVIQGPDTSWVLSFRRTP